MRHRIAGKKLGRKPAHRRATIRDIAKAALICQRICTTKVKAKEARKLVDNLITLGKGGTLAHRRRAFAILCDHKIVKELFDETAPRFRNRIGGYTRVIPLGTRRGDNAQLAFLELTEKKEIVVSKAKSTAAAKTDALKAAPKDQPISKPKSGKVPAAEQDKTQAISEAALIEGKTKPEKKEEPEKTQHGIKEKTTVQHQKKSDIKEKGRDKKTFLKNIRRMFNRKSPGDR